jgi:hypothetical protein
MRRNRVEQPLRAGDPDRSAVWARVLVSIAESFETICHKLGVDAAIPVEGAMHRLRGAADADDACAIFAHAAVDAPLRARREDGRGWGRRHWKRGGRGRRRL